jgi:hypothetical protein
LRCIWQSREITFDISGKTFSKIEDISNFTISHYFQYLENEKKYDQIWENLKDDFKVLSNKMVFEIT